MTKAKNSAQRKKEAKLRRMAQEAEPAKQKTATQSGSASGPAPGPAPPVAGPSHGPAQVLEAGPAAGTDPGPTGTSPAPPRDPRRGAATRPYQDAPNLEPWMRQTVVLKLKDVDGRKPDMNQGTFGKKMVLEQGFAKPEVTSISSFWSGVFFVTFASIEICKRYWERVKTAGADSPFGHFVWNCPIQREERRITVSMRNPHIPGRDITTFLQRFCTVVRDPAHILDENGFWTSKWSVIVRLHKDAASPDGVMHLPQIFSLGNSSGLIYYPDMPQTCRRCGLKGHGAKDCKELACRTCRVAGHETKDCPRKDVCNLCFKGHHIYRDCPDRERSYASVAAKRRADANPAPPPPPPTPAVAAPAAKQKEPKTQTQKKKEVVPQRKRKQKDGHNAEASKKIGVEVLEDRLLDEEDEMEQSAEDLVSDAESDGFPDSVEVALLDRLVEEGLLELPEPTAPIEEKPPDGIGN